MLQKHARACKAVAAQVRLHSLDSSPFRRPKRNDPIIFNVGPWEYSLKIARKLVNDKNEPLMGRCDLHTMIVYVAADIPPQGRLNVVLHELRHAWRFHFPAPRTDEEEADFSATITAAAYRDIRRQRDRLKAKKIMVP